MPKTLAFKCNFSSGVIDPRLQSRLDLSHYENGMDVGDNVRVIPYGGVRRRGGRRHLYTIPSAVGGNGMLAAFSFNSTDQQYLLVFVELRIYFFRNSALITNINGSGNDYLVSPWPIAIARELKWTQSADTMIVVHEDYAPRSLVRGATDATWTLSTITFTRQPKIDYADSLSPAPTSEVQSVVFTGFVTGNTFKLDLENVTSDNITYDSVNTASTAQRIAEALAANYKVATGEVACVFAAGTTYTVTISGGSARDYDVMSGYATSGAGTIAVTETTAGVPRTEDAWSATRGWPRSVTFYEARLIFGGSKSKPQTLFMSKTNGFYDFDLGSGLDDDGIQRTLDTDQINAIQSVTPGRHLQVYTEGAEFFCPDFPITPANSSFRPQTTFGAAQPDPLQLEGATLFLDRYARSLNQFLYNDVEAAYTATSLSRIAASLLNTPVDADVQRSSADDNTNYVHLVNTDGTTAVLSHLRSEEIAAWTRDLTPGVDLSIAALGENVYVLVRRVDGVGANAWSVEHYRDDFYTDDAEQYTAGSPQTVWSVGTWLNGISCRVLGNGAVLANVTPVAGSITLPSAVSRIEIGRNFNAPNTRVKLLPVAVNSVQGQSQLRRCKVHRIETRVRNTAGLMVNGRLPYERRMDVDAMDTPPGLFTGVMRSRSLGWGELRQIEYTQDDPLPMTLLASEYEAEVN